MLLLSSWSSCSRTIVSDDCRSPFIVQPKECRHSPGRNGRQRGARHGLLECAKMNIINHADAIYYFFFTFRPLLDTLGDEGVFVVDYHLMDLAMKKGERRGSTDRNCKQINNKFFFPLERNRS